MTGTVYEDAKFSLTAQQLAKTWSASPERITLMAAQGWQELKDNWSTEAAAIRLLQHAECLLRAESPDTLFYDGPCSPATETCSASRRQINLPGVNYDRCVRRSRDSKSKWPPERDPPSCLD